MIQSVHFVALVGTSLMQRKKMVLVIKSLIKCYAIFPWVHEKLIFNTAGQAVAPRYKVAKYSRYIGMLATDPSIFPINVKDYRTLRKLGQVDKAWKIVKVMTLFGLTVSFIFLSSVSC